MRGSDSVNFSKSVEMTKTSQNPQQNTPKRNWSVSYKICKKCFLLKITFQMHFPQRVATYILRDYFCHNSQKTNNVRLWRNIPVFRCWCQMSLWLWYYYAAVSAIKLSGRSEVGRFWNVVTAITRFNSGQIFWNTIVDQFYQHLLEQTKRFYFGNILRSCSIILLHFTKIFSQARWENLIMAGKDPPILLLLVAAVSWSKSNNFSQMFQKKKIQQFFMT